MRHFIYILTILLINSCSYKTEILVSTDGQKFKVRNYENIDRQRQHDNSIIFKRNYTPMSFPKYSDTIKKDSFEKYVYFEFNKERIYIDKVLLTGSQGDNFVSIIESGLLSPSIIFCALDSLCRPQQDSAMIMTIIGNERIYSNSYRVFDSIFLMERFGWSGIRIQISDIAELPYLGKKNTRVFKFEHKIYHEWPNDAFYFFELTNNKATKNMNFKDFIKGARLTFMKHTWTGHEI